MLNPLNEQEVEFVKQLLEERAMNWSSTWPLERRVIDIGSYRDIPKADGEHHIKERDILHFISGNSCVLYIPEDRISGTQYPLITLTRHQDEGSYGTNKIKCERIFVGEDPFSGSGSVVLKKDFPFFNFAKAELEDAGIWQGFKERDGWKKLEDKFGLYKKYSDRYELDIYGDCDWSVQEIPKEVIHTQIPRGAFKWLSKELGINISLDNFAENAFMMIPQGITLHQIEIDRYKKPRREKMPDERVLVDTYFGLYGTAGLDRTYPGGAFFRDGKLVFGQLGKDGDIRNPESFKQAVVDYFNLPSYELFEMFFYFRGLPEKYRDAVKDII